ncbi:hypothetical protein ACWIUD_05675 [Helicobacter sp. 23-1044]
MQPFLRKETNESNLKNGENLADSAIHAKIAESKKRFFASHKCFAQNDNFVWIATKSCRLLAMTA